MGLVCHAKKQENLVQLQKGHKLGREINRYGKVTILEKGSEWMGPETETLMQWSWKEE